MWLPAAWREGRCAVAGRRGGQGVRGRLAMSGGTDDAAPISAGTLAVALAVSKTSSQRKRGGCLTTWLILNLVVVSGLTLLYFLDIAGSAVLGSSASISPGVFLLFALLGCVGIVGLSALLAWKKWGFYLVALYVVLNIVLAFPLGLFNGIRTFTPLIGLAVLYYLLRRNDVWEHLT